jgi:methionyl-tRNA formyltransferase
MRIEEGLDEGGVYSRLVVPITESDTADSLRDRLCDVGTHELVRLLDEGFPPPVAQSGQASYAHKIVKGELCIDWTNSVDTNSRLVRIGGAYTFFRGERVKVTQARRSKSFTPLGGWSPGGIRVFEGEVSVACGDGVLNLLTIQPAGRSSMSALSWWNGVPSTLVSAGETVRFDR